MVLIGQENAERFGIFPLYWNRGQHAQEGGKNGRTPQKVYAEELSGYKKKKNPKGA